MKKWAIEPSVIRVKKGQIVELDVYTADVEHGFQVTELGINEPVQPRFPATIVFRAEQTGEFKIQCSITCGRGHDDMTGVIIVD
jgi:cytochrome c oxidase subunit 2